MASRRATRAALRRQAARRRLTPVATAAAARLAEVAADDAFLSDLEIALERPHTRELRAFDALTPHVREIRDTSGTALMPSLIFRKGLDLKHAVAGMLADNYHSAIVEHIKARRFHLPRRTG